MLKGSYKILLKEAR